MSTTCACEKISASVNIQCDQYYRFGFLVFLFLHSFLDKCAIASKLWFFFSLETQISVARWEILYSEL